MVPVSSAEVTVQEVHDASLIHLGLDAVAIRVAGTLDDQQLLRLPRRLVEAKALAPADELVLLRRDDEQGPRREAGDGSNRIGEARTGSHRRGGHDRSATDPGQRVADLSQSVADRVVQL